VIHLGWHAKGPDGEAALDPAAFVESDLGLFGQLRVPKGLVPAEITVT
jgi:hypothetical protein